MSESAHEDDRTPEAAIDRLLAGFDLRAAALGVMTRRVADPAAAGAVLAEVAAEAGADGVIIAGELATACPALLPALDERGLRWTLAGDPGTTRDAPMGVSFGHLAVAETASVLLAEPDLADRAIGMLTVTQVVVCPTGGLVPTLDEASDALRAVATRTGGGFATLVTGPSRTADIERVLTVGVQGPARLVVLFLDHLG